MIFQLAHFKTVPTNVIHSINSRHLLITCEKKREILVSRWLCLENFEVFGITERTWHEIKGGMEKPVGENGDQRRITTQRETETKQFLSSSLI